MIQLRPNCECFDKDLPPESTKASLGPVNLYC
jgi:hypothetical protein